jgi:esterase/lipase superfamily enzyme
MPTPTNIYFATNREPITDGSNPPTDFSATFHKLGVTFGKAAVPDWSADSPPMGQLFTLSSLSSQTFLPGLIGEIVGADADQLLFTIHGFDYTFQESIQRAAYLQSWYGAGSLPIKTVVVALCWPSAGKLDPDDYDNDYARAGQSGDAFRILLLSLVSIIAQFKSARAGRRASVIAHSMGNHVLAAGLDSAIGSGPGLYDPQASGALFDQAILAASDEDTDALSHSDKLQPILSLATRTHLYYNNMDLALGGPSRVLHFAGRLGIDGPGDKISFVGTNISFINCSTAEPFNKDGSYVDSTCHQYYRLVPEVRDDICAMMRGLANDDPSVINRTYRQPENYYRLDLGTASQQAGYLLDMPATPGRG